MVRLGAGKHAIVDQLLPGAGNFQRGCAAGGVVERTLLGDAFKQVSGDGQFLLRLAIAANHRCRHLHVGIVLGRLHQCTKRNGLTALNRLHQFGSHAVRNDESERGLLAALIRAAASTQIAPGNLIGTVDRFACGVGERDNAERAEFAHREIVDRADGPAGQHQLAVHVLVDVVLLVFAAAHVDQFGSRRRRTYCPGRATRQYRDS